MDKTKLRRKRQDKVVQELAALNPELAALLAAANSTEPEQPKHLEAEGLLRMLNKPNTYVFKICKHCKEPFGTDYHAVAHCSDECRKVELKKQGFHWTPGRTQTERWGGEPPVILSPALVRKLIEFAVLSLDLPHQYIDDLADGGRPRSGPVEGNQKYQGPELLLEEFPTMKWE